MQHSSINCRWHRLSCEVKVTRYFFLTFPFNICVLLDRFEFNYLVLISRTLSSSDYYAVIILRDREVAHDLSFLHFLLIQQRSLVILSVLELVDLLIWFSDAQNKGSLVLVIFPKYQVQSNHSKGILTLYELVVFIIREKHFLPIPKSSVIVYIHVASI